MDKMSLWRALLRAEEAKLPFRFITASDSIKTFTFGPPPPPPVI